MMMLEMKLMMIKLTLMNDGEVDDHDDHDSVGAQMRDRGSDSEPSVSLQGSQLRRARELSAERATRADDRARSARAARAHQRHVERGAHQVVSTQVRSFQVYSAIAHDRLVMMVMSDDDNVHGGDEMMIMVMMR
jgi:hypothetical protein